MILFWKIHRRHRQLMETADKQQSSSKPFNTSELAEADKQSSSRQQLFNTSELARIALKHSKLSLYLTLKKLDGPQRKSRKFTRARAERLSQPRRGRSHAVKKHLRATKRRRQRGGARDHTASAPALPRPRQRGEFAFLDDVLLRADDGSANATTEFVVAKGQQQHAEKGEQGRRRAGRRRAGRRRRRPPAPKNKKAASGARHTRDIRPAAEEEVSAPAAAAPRPASRGARSRPGTRGSAGSGGALAWRPSSRGSRPGSRGLFSQPGYLSSTSGTGSRPASRAGGPGGRRSRPQSRGSRPRSRSRRPRSREHRDGELRRQLGQLALAGTSEAAVGVAKPAGTDRTGATSMDTGRTEDLFTLFPPVVGSRPPAPARGGPNNKKGAAEEAAFWGFATFARRTAATVSAEKPPQDATALAPCSDGPTLFELMEPEAAAALAHAERRRRVLRRRLHPADWDVPDPRLHAGLREARARAGVTFARVLEHRSTRQDDTEHPCFFASSSDSDGSDAGNDAGAGAPTPGTAGGADDDEEQKQRQQQRRLVQSQAAKKKKANTAPTMSPQEAATDELALKEFFGLWPKIRRYQESYGRDAPIGTGTPRSTYLGKCGELGLVPQPLGLIREDPASIDLRHFGIGDKYGVALGEALRLDRQLTALDVRGNRLGGEGAAGIIDHLPRGLTSLDISSNPIGREGVAALARVLADDTYLAELHVEGVGLDGEQVERLAVPLARQGSLTRLNLSHNAIGGGAAAMPRAVGFGGWRQSQKARRRIQKALAKNAGGIGAGKSGSGGGAGGGRKGGSAVVRAGKGRGAAAARKYNSPSVRAAAVGVEALAAAIARNHFLLELDLSWNNLHGEPAGSIMRALKRNKHLRVVDLSWNLLCTCTGEVAAMLRGNKEIVHLDLSHNNFNRNHCKVLAAGLAANQTCCGLHFAGNAGEIDAGGYLRPHPESLREKSRREDEERQAALREAAAAAAEEARRREEAGEAPRKNSKTKKPKAVSPPPKTKRTAKKRRKRGEGGKSGGWRALAGRGKALEASELQDRHHERRIGAAHVAAFGGRRRGGPTQRRIVAAHHHRARLQGSGVDEQKKERRRARRKERLARKLTRKQPRARGIGGGSPADNGDSASVASSSSLSTDSSSDDGEYAAAAEGAAVKWRSRAMASRATREEARQSRGARRRRRREARKADLARDAAKRRRKRERRRSKRARARRVKDGAKYSNCWLCGRWSEVAFKWTPGESGPYCKSEAGLRVSVHLAFEDWKATPCKLVPGKRDHGYYAAYRVLPPGRHQYYYSVTDMTGAASDQKKQSCLAAEDQPTERTVLDDDDAYSAAAAVANAVEVQEAARHDSADQTRALSRERSALHSDGLGCSFTRNASQCRVTQAKLAAVKEAHRKSAAEKAAAAAAEEVAAKKTALEETRRRLDAAFLNMVQANVGRQAEQDGLSRRDSLERKDVFDRMRSAIAEMKGKIITVFRQLDESGNSRVTKDELVDGLRELGFAPSAGDVAQIWASLDRDNSGEIGYGELKYVLMHDDIDAAAAPADTEAEAKSADDGTFGERRRLRRTSSEIRLDVEKAKLRDVQAQKRRMSVDYRRPSVTERARVSFAAAVAVAAADTPWGKLRHATKGGLASWCLSNPMQHRRACAVAEDVEDLEKADAAFRAAAADKEYRAYVQQLRDAGLRHDPARSQRRTGKNPRSQRKQRKESAKLKQLERYARERREVRRALANMPEHLVTQARQSGAADGKAGGEGGSGEHSADGNRARGTLASLRAAMAAPNDPAGMQSGDGRGGGVGGGRPRDGAVGLFLRRPQLTFKKRCALRGLPAVCNVVEVVKRMTHGGGLPGCKAVPRSLGGAPKWKFSQSCFVRFLNRHHIVCWPS